MGSHFHDWIDYNGVAFSKELLVKTTTTRTLLDGTLTVTLIP